MNLSLLEQLCNKYVVAIDKDNNSLIGNIDHIYFPKIIVPTPRHTFEFKIVWDSERPNNGQIQCLSSFKMLTVRSDGSVFFDTTNNGTCFEIVYDQYALVIFHNNTVLTFTEGGIRLLDYNTHQFTDKEQTIFQLGKINYDNILILSKKEYNPLQYPQCQKIGNLVDFFYYIMTQYDNLGDLVYLELNGSVSIPIDYYIQQENWSILDKRVNINNLEQSARKINNIFELETLYGVESEWKNTGSLSGIIPNTQNIKIVYQKILGILSENFIYYANNGVYIISRSQITNRSRSYYTNIYTLLTKSKDPKTSKLVEISLDHIFYH